MSENQLRQVYDLLADGRQEEALIMLQPIVEAQPENADAWWLMANAEVNRARAIDALENVLRLRPDHPHARTMLAQLQSGEKPKRSPGVQVIKPRNSGCSLVTCFMIFIVGICGFFCVLPTMGLFVAGSEVADVMQEVLAEFNVTLDFDDLDNISITTGVNWDEVRERGMIEVNETRSGTVNFADKDVWEFDGVEEQRIRVVMETNNNATNPQIQIYNSDRELVGGNEATLSSSRVELEMDLPYRGRFYIVVGALGDNGTYELTLDS
jgi:hypothetical protein